MPFRTMRYACLFLCLIGCAHEHTVTTRASLTSDRFRAAVAERLERAADAMFAFRNEIPKTEAARTRCAAIFADVHFIGADGFITCRSQNGWSAPEPVAIKNPSQDGVDLLILVTSQPELEQLERTGLVGNGQTAAYARAGSRIVPVDVGGAIVDLVIGAEKALYGKTKASREVLGGFVSAPPSAEPLLRSTEIVLPLR